jgi:hypothetical protein
VQQQQAAQQQALRNQQAQQQAAQQQALRNQQAQQQQALQDRQAQQQAAQQQQLSQQEQQQRFSLQQQRTSVYQRTVDEQLRAAQAQNAQLQQSRRSQYLVQQQYADGLRQQVQNDRNYDYRNDAFFNTPWSYRYRVGGSYRQTNRYGAELLQRSINYGYQEGFRAGNADRRDRWGYDVHDSFAYRDATYGYEGRYIDRSDYNYYFRMGFRKGYDDGYYRRSRYGSQANGRFTVLRVVLSGILKLEVIR